jgi:hypothetical protein
LTLRSNRPCNSIGWRNHRPPRENAPLLHHRAALGGLLGYGLITAGPGPAPSIFAPGARVWVFGGALVCGVLSALSPTAFWRQNRFRWRHEDDE